MSRRPRNHTHSWVGRFSFSIRWIVVLFVRLRMSISQTDLNLVIIEASDSFAGPILVIFLCTRYFCTLFFLETSIKVVDKQIF